MQETEAKFYVQDLKQVEARLKNLGARLVQPRVLETNIRFDLPDGRLRAEHRLLRLRRDTESRLTYKSPSINEQGILSRTEIEFLVSDFETAKQFLEALGYQPVFLYEKYRMTYASQSSEGLPHVMLDELPYGNFVEIEDETIEPIRELAAALGLNWDTAIATSYHALFGRVNKTLNLPFFDLSFENFSGLHIRAADLGVRPADESPKTEAQ
jgi:adenylate cyclase class 2